MSVALRLARGGQKKRPYYRIVATDKRNARDGRFIEKLGTFNPMLPKESEHRVTLVHDRIKYWLSVGAQPSDRVHGFLFKAGLVEKPLDVSHKPVKTRRDPKKKTRAELRIENEAAAAEKIAAEAAAAIEAEKAAAQAAKEAAEAPAVEAEAPAEEAPAA